MPIPKPYSITASFPGEGAERWWLGSFVSLNEAIESCNQTRREFPEILLTSENVFIEISKKEETMEYSNTMDGLVGDLLLTMLANNGRRLSAVIVCATRNQVDEIEAMLERRNKELPVSLDRVAPMAFGIGSRSIRFLLPGALLAGYEFDIAILIDCDTVSQVWLEDLGRRISAGGQIQAYRSRHHSLERNIELESIAMRVQPAKLRHTPNVGSEDVYARIEALEKSLEDLTGMVRIISEIQLRRSGYISDLAEWIKKLLLK